MESNKSIRKQRVRKSKKEQQPTAEIINFYQLEAVQAFEEKAHNPNYDVHGIKIPFRMLVIGSSGSGKTNVIVNLIQQMENTFHNIYIYTRAKGEPLYQFLESRIPPEFLKIEEGLDSFNKLDPNKAYDKTKQTLIVFDDLVLEKDQSKITELFIRGRKLGVSLIYISQSYYRIPITIRGQSTYLILKKIASTRDLTSILRDSSLGIDKTILNRIYKYCTQELTDFLLIDKEAIQEQIFRHNFDEILDISNFQ
jgi:hypothetical protein